MTDSPNMPLGDALRVVADVADALDPIDGLMTWVTFDGLMVLATDTDAGRRKATLAVAAKGVLEATGAPLGKEYRDGAIVLRAAISPAVSVTLKASDVCAARVVGTRTVTRTETVTPAETREVEAVEEVVEWDCDGSVLANAPDVIAAGDDAALVGGDA